MVSCALQTFLGSCRFGLGPATCRVWQPPASQRIADCIDGVRYLSLPKGVQILCKEGQPACTDTWECSLSFSSASGGGHLMCNSSVVSHTLN